MPPVTRPISADRPHTYQHRSAAGIISTSSTSHWNALTNQPGYAVTTVNLYDSTFDQFVGGSTNFTERPIHLPLPERPIHLPLPVNNCVSANLPLPPNWNENIKTTAHSSQPYRHFPVDSESREFRKLKKLLDPLHICYIDQIVIPTLWTRFVNERNGMLKSKCNDPTVLKELGLRGYQIEQKQRSINFLRHNAVDAASFDDNFALLFHCTKNRANADKIQRYGFDERLSSGGTLGRGIYFTDSPRKAIQYDCGSFGELFVCAVLLGDCMQDSAGYTSLLTKQPEKLLAERRYIDDYNFDSVMGQRRHNKYAVYNRYQCYPMYKVVYSRWESNFGPTSSSDVPSTPPFVWQNEFRQPVDSTWAFHARTVFEEMKEVEAPRQ